MDQPALMQPVYDVLFDSLSTEPPYGGPAILDAAQSHLSLLFPGSPLVAGDFVDPWSPSNLHGSPLAAECFARLSDRVPTLSPICTYRGQSLDLLYGRVVCADLFSAPSTGGASRKSAPSSPRSRSFKARGAPRPDSPKAAAPVTAQSSRIQRTDLSRLKMLHPAELLLKGVAALPAAEQEAFKLLHREAAACDASGARIKILGPSARYEEYLAHKLRYESAALRFMAHHLSRDGSEPAGPGGTGVPDGEDRDARAQSLETTLTQLRQLLTTTEAKKIEEAVHTWETSAACGGIAAVLFDAARLTYERTKRSGTLAPYGHWHASQASPSNWCDPSAESIPVCVSSEQSAGNGRSRMREPGVMDLIDRGLWHVGEPHQGAVPALVLSPLTKNLRITFGFQRVQIIRPWLQGMLLRLGSWSQSGQARHTYSTGSVTENPGSFPLLPVAMIVARDVQITADWSPEDQALYSWYIKAGKRLALGPFALSGTYRCRAGEHRLQTIAEGATIKVPGLQLIGWVSEVVPACPPRDG